MSNFSYTISIGQLGEQLTLNQWVLGSSPRWRTKKVPVKRPGFFVAPSPWRGRARTSRYALVFASRGPVAKNAPQERFLHAPADDAPKKSRSRDRDFLLRHPLRGRARTSRCALVFASRGPVAKNAPQERFLHAPADGAPGFSREGKRRRRNERACGLCGNRQVERPRSFVAPSPLTRTCFRPKDRNRFGLVEFLPIAW